MVLVDYSAWKEALNHDSETSVDFRYKLEILLDNYLVTVSEFTKAKLLCAIEPEHRDLVFDRISHLPVLETNPTIWSIAIQLTWELRDRGLEVEPEDALSPAISLRHHIPLLSSSNVHIEVAKIRKIETVS